jgi:predicted O-methyltransferase YrrM
MPVKEAAKLSDWDYVLNYRARGKTDDPEGITPEALRKRWLERDEAAQRLQGHPVGKGDYTALDAKRGRLGELGVSWQEMAMAMVTSMDLGKVVVETGVRTGVSTRFLMLATAVSGQLHSIDPLYASQTKAEQALVRAMGGLPLPKSHPAITSEGHWTFYGKRSIECLLDIAKSTGGWDVFIHDSDHRLENMTFELEFGWSMLRQGGLLICDDWEYPKPSGNPHGAFLRFCQRRDLEFHTIGSAAVVEKGEAGFEAVPFKNDPAMLFKAAVSVAVEDKRTLQKGSEPQYVTFMND